MKRILLALLVSSVLLLLSACASPEPKVLPYPGPGAPPPPVGYTYDLPPKPIPTPEPVPTLSPSLAPEPMPEPTPPPEPEPAQTGTESKFIYYDGDIYVGADGEPIELINNPTATDVTYEELMDFIANDLTDEKTYYNLLYVCADFAEEVHNNAEEAGIRAAWVGIELEEEDGGHAINAFQTIDKGLVFIDCTGQESKIIKFGEVQRDNWDNVAYVEIGKPYGIIPVSYAKSLSYDYFEQYTESCYEYERLLSDYNEEVALYNQEIRGKVYYEGSPELARIEAWEAELEEKSQELAELGEELGDFWVEPGSIVADIIIYWQSNS